MTTHRFIGDFDLSKKKVITSDKDVINQMKNVLRLTTGKQLILSDGKGNEADATIVELQNNHLGFDIENARQNENEPPVEGILYCSILKRENFELVVQKATEIGIARIQPVIAERTVKLGLRTDRLQKIMKEAAEQSGRAMLPTLNDPVDFEVAVKEAIDNDGNFFFDPHKKKEYPHDARLVDSAGIFIGPEGGWTDKERDLADHFRFHFVRLGKLTLRAETAAMIASYFAVYGGVIE